MNVSSKIERARALRDEIEELMVPDSTEETLVINLDKEKRLEEADVEFWKLVHDLNDAGEAPEDLTREGLMRRAREYDKAKGR